MSAQLTPDAIRVLRDVAERGCVVNWYYQTPHPFYGDGVTPMPHEDYNVLDSLIHITVTPAVGRIVKGIYYTERGYVGDHHYVEKLYFPNAEGVTMSEDGHFVVDKAKGIQLSFEYDIGSGEAQEIERDFATYSYLDRQVTSDYVQFVNVTDEFTSNAEADGTYSRAQLKTLAIAALNGGAK